MQILLRELNIAVDPADCLKPGEKTLGRQIGELALMLWLVIKGAKPQPLDATALSSAAA